MKNEDDLMKFSRKILVTDEKTNIVGFCCRGVLFACLFYPLSPKSQFIAVVQLCFIEMKTHRINVSKGESIILVGAGIA